MFVARWQIDTRFGHKQTAIDKMKEWESKIGKEVGLHEMDFQILTGSIGAHEATVETSHRVETLERLERFFEDIAKIEAHRKWGKELEPYVVSGTSRWKVYRVVS